MLRLVLRQHGVQMKPPASSGSCAGNDSPASALERPPPRLLEVAQAATARSSSGRRRARRRAGARRRRTGDRGRAPRRRGGRAGSWARRDPLLLEVGDVAEVPDDRAHQRAVLAGQLLFAERRDELEGAAARVARGACSATSAHASGAPASLAAPQEQEREGAWSDRCASPPCSKPWRAALADISGDAELAADLGAGPSRRLRGGSGGPSSGQLDDRAGGVKRAKMSMRSLVSFQ